MKRTQNLKKLKKLTATAIALLLLLTLAGCGEDDTASYTENGSEAVSTYEEDSEQTEQTEPPEEWDDGEISPEFKKTMDDYEAWFDHYCEVLKNYQDDPGDIGLLNEMTELLSEETEMLEQMDNMDQSEMTAAELGYYLEVTARIEKKLLEVADY